MSWENDGKKRGGLRGIENYSFNLKAAVAREKAVQAIDGHRECKNCMVTFWVMSQFSHLQGVVQTFVIQLLLLGSRKSNVCT
jgi:hypothetical protein